MFHLIFEILYQLLQLMINQNCAIQKIDRQFFLLAYNVAKFAKAHKNFAVKIQFDEKQIMLCTFFVEFFSFAQISHNFWFDVQILLHCQKEFQQQTYAHKTQKVSQIIFATDVIIHNKVNIICIQILHVLIRINNYIFIKQNNHTNILYNTFIQNNYHNIFFFNYCDDLGNKNFISLFDLNKFVNKNQPYRILIKIIISWIQKHNVCNFRLTMKRRQKFMCYIFCGLFILINDYEINSFIFARYT
eukprot:TRINITY_DN2849_c0_g1_i14.p1 TRINITY_DN2849_c0_g1~~TRINITY_DN2849_c0_g1_i14.p1  ORF type:complete len:245 (+),score=-13.87 TRINITY_DN2849_c0_g1_i14:795-1529(+)